MCILEWEIYVAFSGSWSYVAAAALLNIAAVGAYLYNTYIRGIIEGAVPVLEWP